MAIKEHTTPPALPTPAPLPSLSAAFSRRAAIFGGMMVGATAAGAGAAALALPLVPQPFDARFIDLQRTAMTLRAYSDHPDTDGELGDEAFTKAFHLQHDAMDMTVTTPAGALAALLWGREEFARHYVDEAEAPDWADCFTLRMIDNAIAVLRAAVDAAVVVQ